MSILVFTLWGGNPAKIYCFDLFWFFAQVLFSQALSMDYMLIFFSRPGSNITFLTKSFSIPGAWEISPAPWCPCYLYFSWNDHNSYTYVFTMTNPLTDNKQEDRALGSIHRCVLQNTQQGPCLTSGWCSEVLLNWTESNSWLRWIGVGYG